MRTILCLCSLISLAAAVAAQDLRRGLVDADAVVVARQVGKKDFDDDVTLHRLQVLRDVRGGGEAKVLTVIDWPKLSLHNRPMPRQSRLYCLQSATEQAARIGLPADEGPYFKMVGWQGTNPLVGADLEKDPVVGFADLLARSEVGAAPAETAGALCTAALTGNPSVRTEAARYLAERPLLRAQLNGVQWSQLLVRTGGEVDDVPHKIALAELCAEQRLDGLLDALVVSLGPVEDPEYARTVGRIGALLHGEQATAMLEARLRKAGQPEDRAALLLAIGATNTDTALEALMRLDSVGSGPAGSDPAVTAALREHRSPRAREAVKGRR